MRLDAAIAGAAKSLADISDSARLDAEILLCQTIDMPRSYLFAHPEDELDELTRQRFEALLQRRLQGEPMSYISGIQEFWSRELIVSPATLIPRPETELLVELALRESTAAGGMANSGFGHGQRRYCHCHRKRAPALSCDGYGYQRRRARRCC